MGDAEGGWIQKQNPKQKNILSVTGGSWDVQDRTEPGAVVTSFWSPRKKEFKSETDIGTHGMLTEMKVHT